MSEKMPISPEVLGSSECIADPYPAYRALRETSPVRFIRVYTGQTEPLYAYALLRHADALAAMRDPTTFSSESPRVFKAVPKVALLHDDPPHHTRLRRLVNKAFTAQRIAALAGPVEALVNELADGMGKGSVELMETYAFPLPARVIAGMLGVPGDHHDAFRGWSRAAISYVGMPAEERARAIQEFMGYLTGIITARRQAPQDDMITAFTQAEAEGTTLSDAEIRALAFILLIAGHETTTGLIGNMLGILADRPELYERARADRSLVEPIIEETLRFESPVQRFPRVTTREVEVSGVRIPADHLVDVFHGAANRDPAVFEDPDTFQLHRPNKDHVGFGHGIHFCLGAPLARLEARITLNMILDRFATVKRGEEPAERQRMAPVSLSYKRLPLVLGS
jgi:cytochrome P450